MKSLPIATLFAAVALPASLLATRAAAHCQVPCGIYGDQRKFEEMLEDTATITKAIAQIGELACTHNATGHNQLARWVANKEKHATNIQFVVGDYFLAQRVKADKPQYVAQLKACHAVIVAAMKSKQSADPATAATLKAAILDLYRAYEGKEPAFADARAPVGQFAKQYVVKRDLAGHAHAGHAHAE